VADAGAWHYAFIYDCVARAYPELLEQSRFLGELDARAQLVEAYFQSVGAAQMRDVSRLFQWGASELERAVERLVTKGLLKRGLEIEGTRGEWITLEALG
jgi:hypothetical protein